MKEGDLTMPTNLDVAIKKDYAQYKKELASLEKQKQLIDKKIVLLAKKFAPVLSFLKPGSKPAQANQRAKRGQSKELIVAALKKAKNPLKGFEIISAVTGKVSAASVRQQLPKLVKEGVLKKDKQKAYSVK